MEQVKISVATPAAPYASESAWADPLDVPAGRYRVGNILFFPEGVSNGDVVRCEPTAAGRLVAVEVLERSELDTIVFGVADTPPAPAPGEQAENLARSLAAEFIDAFGDVTDGSSGFGLESGFGLVGVQIAAGARDAVLEVAMRLSDDAGFGREVQGNESEGRVGAFIFFVATEPTLPVPYPLPGADELLAEPAPDFHAPNWDPADCPVASQWPKPVVDLARDYGMRTKEGAQDLEARRYMSFLAVQLRQGAFAQFGVEATGPQPFPLFTSAPGAPEWLEAHDADGRVRWCADDDANAAFRQQFVLLGIDPDHDPALPIVERYVG